MFKGSGVGLDAGAPELPLGCPYVRVEGELGFGINIPTNRILHTVLKRDEIAKL